MHREGISEAPDENAMWIQDYYDDDDDNDDV